MCIHIKHKLGNDTCLSNVWQEAEMGNNTNIKDGTPAYTTIYDHQGVDSATKCEKAKTTVRKWDPFSHVRRENIEEWTRNSSP